MSNLSVNSGLSVNSDSSSMIALHHLERGNRAIAASMEKLATGSRINRGTDDPAGLIASEDLRATLEALDAETRAMERTDAVANVADAALGEMSAILSDAHAAEVAMANTGGMSAAERDAHQMEIDSARQSVERIAATTTFNGQRVLDGSVTLRVGAPEGGASIELDRVAPSEGPDSIDALRERITSMRAELGSFQKNALGAAMRTSAAEFENTAAAESVIRDTDFASETANLARHLTLADAQRMGVMLSNRRTGWAGDVLRLLS